MMGMFLNSGITPMAITGSLTMSHADIPKGWGFCTTKMKQAMVQKI